MKRLAFALRPRLAAGAWPWRWAVPAALVFVTACGIVLVPMHGRPSASASTSASASPDEAQARAQAHPRLRLEPAGSAVLAFQAPTIALNNSPEGRLIAAYVAVGEGDGRKAFEVVSALVRDHPEFSLAQLLYGDLLATRAGVPSSFGGDGHLAAAAVEDRPPSAVDGAQRAALREEAVRRLAALSERPPPGEVPVEFVQLPASSRHAVAVDVSRSRLYLFSNGPDGLKLERDVYVSIGKQGFAKQVEGDRRTPLGVYWITAAVPKSQLDERFGHAALRFSYPNAWDRMLGRTGTGLYLHGVPPQVLNHAPWATDGCVAMANDEVDRLLRTLDIDTTPVVIARQLQWAPAYQARRLAGDFVSAYRSWDEARRNAEAGALARWYDGSAAGTRDAARDRKPRQDVSFVAWYGDETPVMVVTSRPQAAAGEPAAPTHRQYWAQREGQWRILFEGPVSMSESAPVRAQAPADARRLSATTPHRKAERSAATRAAAAAHT